MAKLHLFNPDNDLALAANIDNYTPPKAALQLRRDAALLPLWYADADDRVVCHGVNAQWLETRHREFSCIADIYDYHPEGLTAAPWGWSRAVRQSFIHEGYPASELPDDSTLTRLRDLSHRSTAARVHSQLIDLLPDIHLPHPAVEAKNAEEVARLIEQWGDVYVKQPWSGSGRGVVCSIGNREGALHMAAAFIARQGSAMVEPALTDAQDFAMLFRCHDGRAEWIGTSVFSTDTQGHYTGNLLVPEQQRFAQISALYPAENLFAVRESLSGILSTEIAPFYTGVLGVDMLITTDGLLHPAVEINLRHTMGYVANRFADKHLHPGSRGQFRIVPFKNAKELPPENYQTADGMLVSGCLHLCPTPTSGFAAIVEVTTH